MYLPLLLLLVISSAIASVVSTARHSKRTYRVYLTRSVLGAVILGVFLCLFSRNAVLAFGFLGVTPLILNSVLLALRWEPRTWVAPVILEAGLLAMAVLFYQYGI